MVPLSAKVIILNASGMRMRCICGSLKPLSDAATRLELTIMPIGTSVRGIQNMCKERSRHI